MGRTNSNSNNNNYAAGGRGSDSPGQSSALTCLDQLDTEGLAHLLHRGQQRAAEMGREMAELVEGREEEMVKVREEMAELEETGARGGGEDEEDGGNRGGM